MSKTSNSAERLFEALSNALSSSADAPGAYEGLYAVFRSILREGTATVQIRFAGDYPRTDYLLKEHRADRRMQYAVNTTRRRLSDRLSLSPEEAETHLREDFQHIAEFISLVFHAPLPPEVVLQFPEQQQSASAQRILTDVLRCSVIEASEQSLLVSAGGEELSVGLSDETAYLSSLVHPGTQLNLVRPTLSGGMLRPELIIYEPDYLINITSIARCFSNYADSALVDTIHKLQPEQSSEAILLGNMASLLLDETLHRYNQTSHPADLPADHPQPPTSDLPEVDYASLAHHFFLENTVSLLTTPTKPEFHRDARLQLRNILHSVCQTLPQDVSHFSPKEGILEPSFFCEMLGLQGRMDYLQSDFKLLLEQKSGKGAFPQDDFSVPRQTQEHYVQLLLYMLIIRLNFSRQFEANHHELHAFLLYSKYSQSLLRVGYAPTLVGQAIRLRNELAHRELLYSTPQAFDFLLSADAECFNLKHTNNALWTRFQKPQIESILSPLHDASPTEQAYFLRFMTFVSREHVLSKLGDAQSPGSGFASAWRDSLADKLLCGSIIPGLQIDRQALPSSDRVETVRLLLPEGAEASTGNFRRGDIIVLHSYPPDEEPDVRRSIVWRGTLAHLSTTHIDVQLRVPQTDSRAFQQAASHLWAIEHDFMESSSASLFRGLHALLSAPQRRRDLLFFQRPPQTDSSLSLRGDYGSFNSLMLRVRQARDLFLIVGPPGTGKTSFGMLNTVREELLQPGSRLLLTAYTNRAVDEICSKLVEEKIDFVRLGHSFSCAEPYHPYLLSSIAASCPTLQELRQRVLGCRIVVGTTTTLNANIPFLLMQHFSLAVVDEASQILEPHLCGLLAASIDGHSCIDRFVLIGDQKQLPAVVQQSAADSRIDHPLLNAIGLTDCRHSLFERLLNRYSADPSCVYRLTHQGRMHPDIARFPSEAFYAGSLLPVPLPHQQALLPSTGKGLHSIDDLLLTRRLCFISLPPSPSPTTDNSNPEEAAVIAATVHHIYLCEQQRGFLPDRTVGIIVPYRNQISAIRSALSRFGIPSLEEVSIDTVERFQGSQRKYIVYGFTVQTQAQLHFLTDTSFLDPTDGTLVDRKLNVAMTRAEEHLILVGNTQLLSADPIFRRLIEFARRGGNLLHLSAEEYVGGHFLLSDHCSE